MQSIVNEQPPEQYPHYVLGDLDESGKMPVNVYWKVNVVHGAIMEIVVQMEGEEPEPLLIEHAQRVVATLNEKVAEEVRAKFLETQVSRLQKTLYQYEEGVKFMLQDDREDALICFLGAKLGTQPTVSKA